MACSKMNIKSSMIDYSTMWHGLHPNKSQTTLFREIVPIDAVDFSGKFRSSGLSTVFIGDRLRHGEGFNCNHLYRDIRTVAAIVVYSNGRNTVIAPLGDPGRDTDKNKVAHLMVISHAEDGPVTFNEMLPSTFGELGDLEERIETMRQAIHNLQSNSRISDCGEKVVSKAASLDVPDTMGIREFMAYQILNMKDSVRKGFANGGDGPGYKLIGNDGSDICQDEEKVRSAIEEVFGGDLRGRMFIQGPNRNTQILSHIHMFMLSDSEDLPKTLDDNYLDVEVILKIKQEFVTDVPLIRTKTPPPPVEHVDEDEPLSRTQSSRNFGHRNGD